MLIVCEKTSLGEGGRGKRGGISTQIRNFSPDCKIHITFVCFCSVSAPFSFLFIYFILDSTHFIHVRINSARYAQFKQCAHWVAWNETRMSKQKRHFKSICIRPLQAHSLRNCELFFSEKGGGGGGGVLDFSVQTTYNYLESHSTPLCARDRGSVGIWKRYICLTIYRNFRTFWIIDCVEKHYASRMIPPSFSLPFSLHLSIFPILSDFHAWYALNVFK